MNDKEIGRRLRVGMIGVGGVAQKYVGAYAAYPRAALAAVCDADPAVADAAAAAHGATVAASAETLVAADIDAVVISTPNFLHHAQAAMALDAGKHVLLQKPMTVTAAEAHDLNDLAAARGVRLGLYMNSLDNPVIRDLKAMIDAGCFGRVGAINAKLANGRGASFKTADGAATWRGSRQAVGGGSFAMLAYHYINLAQWLLDQPITGITAVAANLMSPHIEGDDIMAGIATFRDGGLGLLESSWCVKGEQMSIHGSEGSAALIDNTALTLSAAQPFEGEVITYETPGRRIVIEGLAAAEMGDWRNPFNQHRQFVDAVLDGRPPPVPGARGVQDMLVLEAAYRSAASGRLEAIEAVW